jgi:hypothetical protein
MTTSDSPHHARESVLDTPASGRRLRLRLTDHPGRDVLDGGWWPRSRDAEVELAELVDQFPVRRGRITGVLVSPADWGPHPRTVRVAHGMVKVGSLPRSDTHVVHLTTSNRTLLRVLVVPPDLTDYQGEEALLAAATAGNAHPASELLRTVTDSADVDPRDHWT